nr:MAG: capsid protein [Cressdnaviricota sp.]
MALEVFNPVRRPGINPINYLIAARQAYDFGQEVARTYRRGVAAAQQARSIINHYLVDDEKESRYQTPSRKRAHNSKLTPKANKRFKRLATSDKSFQSSLNKSSVSRQLSMPLRRNGKIRRRRRNVRRGRRRPIRNRRFRRRFGRRGGRMNRRKALRLLSMTQPIDRILYQAATQVTAPASTTGQGIQKVFFLPPAQNKSNSQVTSGYGTKYVDSFLLAFSNINGSNTGNLALRLMHKATFISHTMANMSNGYAYLTSYRCIARKDIAYFDAPLTNLKDGWTAGNQSGAPAVTAAPLTFTPFMSPTFCEQYKIGRKRTIKMLPGQIINFSLKYKKVFQVNLPLLVEPTDQSTSVLTAGQKWLFLKGNVFYLFSLHGALMNDSTTSTDICTSAPLLNISTRFSMEYQYVVTDTSTFYNYGATGFTAAPVAPEGVDPISGLFASITNAP